MIPISGLARLSKEFIEITGPESAKFLNGLVTSRFLPNIVKKNQYTISENENRHKTLSDTIKMDQNWGLMHEDIYDPEQQILIRRDGLNSMFLNSKGRVLTSCYLFSKPFHDLKAKSEAIKKNPDYLVEIEKNVTSKLQMLLNMHKLSANVKFSKPSLFSYYYYNDSLEFDDYLEDVQSKYFQTFTPEEAVEGANKFIEEQAVFNLDQSDKIVSFAIDNRIPNFGLKFVTSEPIDESIFSESFKKNFKIDEIPEESVTDRRFLNGLFESSDAPKDAQILPFDMNLDYINGLSLDKGCYVGQELTIRTFNSGIIRKRIVPVQFFKIERETLQELANEPINLDYHDGVLEDLKVLSSSTLDKLEITPLFEEEKPASTNQDNSPFASKKSVRKRKPSSGKLLAINKNLGFMLVKLDDIPKSFFKFELPCLDNGVKVVGVKVYTPEWWPED